MGRIDEVVTPPVMLALPQVFNQSPDSRALRVPDDKPRAGLVMYGEQVQIASDDTVIAPTRLLQSLEMLVQGFLGLERGAVDALEHGAVLVTTPVGPGDVEQLECGYPAG